MEQGLGEKVLTDLHHLKSIDPRLNDAWPLLRRCLIDMLPEVKAGAGALVDGRLAALAFDSASLYVISYDFAGDDDQVPEFQIYRLPLQRDQVRLKITDRRAGQHPTSNVAAHTRLWSIAWPDGETVSFASVVRIPNGWDDGPDSAEFFGRALAAELGWVMPR